MLMKSLAELLANLLRLWLLVDFVFQIECESSIVCRVQFLSALGSIGLAAGRID